MINQSLDCFVVVFDFSRYVCVASMSSRKVNSKPRLRVQCVFQCVLCFQENLTYASVIFSVYVEKGKDVEHWKLAELDVSFVSI